MSELQLAYESSRRKSANKVSDEDIEKNKGKWCEVISEPDYCPHTDGSLGRSRERLIVSDRKIKPSIGEDYGTERIYNRKGEKVYDARDEWNEPEVTLETCPF